MAFSIQAIDGSSIIKIIYSGDVTLDERINVVHELSVDYYKASQAFRILIDARLITTQITPNEQILFGTYIASREEFKDSLVAVIINHGQIINHTIIKESSLLGHNIKVFHAENEALAWLNKI